MRTFSVLRCRKTGHSARSLMVLLAAAVAAAAPSAAAAAGGDPIRLGDDHAGSGVRREPGSTAGGSSPSAAVGIRGMDVSGHQGNVDWSAAWRAGARFAYVKATESTGYRNPYFAQQYNGSYRVGMIRGAYHFALPDRSGGAVQAAYFVRHGGGWSADGKTLPPALDIEYNPYGSICYGLSPVAMVAWIRSFSNRVRALTRRYPTIYSNLDWWSRCTGNSGSFARTNPLWVARYSTNPGTLPGGWASYRIWQYDDAGSLPGDQDLFRGGLGALRAWARWR